MSLYSWEVSPIKVSNIVFLIRMESFIKFSDAGALYTLAGGVS